MARPWPRICIRALVASVLGFGLWVDASIANADSSVLVLRQTDDRTSDLVDALIGKSRFDGAKAVCHWQQRRNEKSSDAHAQATIDLATVMMAEKIETNQFSELDAKEACQPIDELLSEYPDHPRQLFLQSGKNRIQQMAVQVDVAATALSVDDETKTIPTMTRLTRLMRETEGLLDLANKSYRHPIRMICDGSNKNCLSARCRWLCCKLSFSPQAVPMRSRRQPGLFRQPTLHVQACQSIRPLARKWNE